MPEAETQGPVHSKGDEMMIENAEIRVMDKEIVDHLLSTNVKNRPIRKVTVDAYARDIAAGNWKLTNQGIGISSDGFLLDGQHRLEALKKAGYPRVKMLIVWGLDNESQNVIDQHAKRGQRDVFRLVYNTSTAPIVPAVCAVLLRSQKKGGTRVTVDEAFASYNEHKDAIDDILQNIVSVKFFPAPMLAAAVVVYEKNQDRLGDILSFFEAVRTGENITRDMPAYHLRNYLIASKKGRGAGNEQKERLGKTIKALQAHLDGKPMHTLRRPQ